MITCLNTEGLDIPCHNSHISFEESVKFLPDSIRKEIRLLVKQYDIITIEQLGERETYDELGFIHSTLITYGANYERIFIRGQKHNVKIEYRNRETGQMFFKVFKSY